MSGSVKEMLVLSLFPGLGLLDRAFELEGFCVVRGPDALWGGDIALFHPPASRFDGVIGGPPCQAFSGLNNLNGGIWRNNLISEFERIVSAAQPRWFLMENVRTAPVPSVRGYEVRDRLLNNRHLGEEQNRVRRFSFGTRGGTPLHFVTEALENFTWEPTVTAAHGGERRAHFKKSTGGKIRRYTVPEALKAQGLPTDFFERCRPRPPFTRYGQLKMIAEGVPLPMGRELARAVKHALWHTKRKEEGDDGDAIAATEQG